MICKSIHIFHINILILILNINVYSATYYISPLGSDDNRGDKNNPWKTIGKANVTLQPGDTAVIRGGVYYETIEPLRSGHAGKYITYINYENEEVIICKVNLVVDISNKDYITIKGIKGKSSQGWVSLKKGGSFNIIENCEFIADSSTTNWAGIWLQDGASYNKIINNSVTGSSMGPHDLIYIRIGSYNLIANNIIIGGLHNGINILGKTGPTTHNIIKDNLVKNKWHTGISLWKGTNSSVVEGNIVLNSGEDHAINYHGSQRDRVLRRSRHNGIQIGASNCIIRSNYLYNNGNAISINSFNNDFPAEENLIYNNVFHRNYTGFSISSAGPVNHNVLVSNLFLSQLTYHITRSPGNIPYMLKLINNYFTKGKIFFAPLGISTLDELQAEFPDLWKNNHLIDSVGNFSLKLISRCTLTKTMFSGTGKELVVQNAGFFTNGHGIIEGDIIQLEGQKITAKVTGIIDNTLLLDKSLSWYEGQGLRLVSNPARLIYANKLVDKISR